MSTRVVASVIEVDGKLLVCQRPAHKRHGGLWEFPGGKIEPGESDFEAVERELAGLPRPQRLVIVGSNSWYSDHVMGEAATVDGRIVPANPGNIELMEASIYWLAGQDDSIAQSATARAVPLIRSLDRGTLRLLRWVAIAGLPGAVLGLGVVWRLTRG